MRGWRDTQLAVVRCSRPGPLLLPGLENALTAPGRFGVFPLPTPTACKFGARPASSIQCGRRRILKNHFGVRRIARVDRFIFARREHVLHPSIGLAGPTAGGSPDVVLCPALAPFIADRLRGVLRCCSADKASCVVAPGDQEFFRVTSGAGRKGPRSCGSSAGAWLAKLERVRPSGCCHPSGPMTRLTGWVASGNAPHLLSSTPW
jgi:hypothetical protein